MKVCVFGLGEAGSLFSRDLAAAGVVVGAFDPATSGHTRWCDPVRRPRHGRRRHRSRLALTARGRRTRPRFARRSATSRPARSTPICRRALRRSSVLTRRPALTVISPSSTSRLMSPHARKGHADTRVLASGDGADRYVALLPRYLRRARVRLRRRPASPKGGHAGPELDRARRLVDEHPQTIDGAAPAARAPPATPSRSGGRRDRRPPEPDEATPDREAVLTSPSRSRWH